MRRNDPARVQMAGLDPLPYPVVARATVPDVGARPSTTRPSPPGAHATLRWSRAAAAGRPQDSCLAPQRDLLIRRPGRQDEHLATRPHQRQFPNRAPDQPQRGTPTRVPDGEAHPWPPPTCPAHHRPTNARASRNRANPANPRPQTAAVPSTSKVCTAVRSGLPARGLGAATAAIAALPASGSPARRDGRPRHAARCPPRSRSGRG
jgi:hypothetical protein